MQGSVTKNERINIFTKKQIKSFLIVIGLKINFLKIYQLILMIKNSNNPTINIKNKNRFFKKKKNYFFCW
jgi:hypothetical protein